MSPLRRSVTSLFFLMLRRLLPLVGSVACFLTSGCVSSPPSLPAPAVAVTPASTEAGGNTDARACPAAKEYIATDKFLAGQKAYQLEAKEREVIAQQVSSGCAGAAQRFASSVRLLVAAGLGLNNALETGIALAHTDDSTTTGFKQVFSRCFLKEHLDLDLLNCLKVARWLSLSGQGAIQPDNFVKAVKGCQQMKLSHSRCAKLAIRLARVPFNSPRYSAADTFAAMFKFLAGQDGPSFNIPKALKMAEFLASHSPTSAENYRVAYRFARKNQDRRRAHAFALGLAKKLPRLRQAE